MTALISPTIVWIALAAVTATGALLLRHITLKAPTTIVMLGLLVGIGYAGLSTQRDNARLEQIRAQHEIAVNRYTAEVNRFNSEQRDYDVCNSRADASEAARLNFLRLYDLVDAQAAADGRPPLTGPARNALLPAFDRSQCKEPTPVTIPFPED